MPSIPRKCHLESTMFRIRYAEIHEQSCDSSRDPEVTASSGRHVAPCHLQIWLSAPGRLRTLQIGNNPRSPSFISLTISCIDSVTQSDFVSAVYRQPT
jgi:hypothetical protein